METRIKTQQAIGGNGWSPVDETWAYASADAPTFTITIPSGGASRYSAGMRVKLTQTTVKYFIITVVADTVLTVYGGTDYTLTNATIVSPQISSVKAPLDFPLDPTKWTVETRDTDIRQQASPSASTFYNIASLNVVVPIGLWKINYQANYHMRASSAVAEAYIGLSTANNSFSDADLRRSVHGMVSTTSNFGGVVYSEKYILLASKSTYYLNEMWAGSGVNDLYLRGDLGSTIIRATCAYL